MKRRTVTEWENEVLSKPLASKVSGEHDLHTSDNTEYVPRIRLDRVEYCGCEQCVIIRIKRRRAFRFPMKKCENCGQLCFSLFTICKECRK